MNTIAAHFYRRSILCALLVGISASHAEADAFGSGANAFSMDFVTIGNAGNPSNLGNLGAVGYTYRMGVTEVPQISIENAAASGLTNVTAGAWVGMQPAANMSWYEMAAFVNWLNTSTGHQAAYNLHFSGGNWGLTLWNSSEAWQLGGTDLYRHKDAYYFLPNPNEWYKSGYHKNDGATGNYWAYATGSDTAPAPVGGGTAAGTAVYNSAASTPVGVDNAGGLSAYGTRGQNGNVYEYLENGAFFGSVYAIGGSWNNPATDFLNFYNLDASSGDQSGNGFRVASIVPEPASALLLFSGAAAISLLRRRSR